MTVKSPFYVIEEFISPLMCEDIIQRLDNKFPNRDADNKPLKTIRASKLSEVRLLPDLRSIIPDLEAYYGFSYLGLQPLEFEWYPTDFVEIPPRCENSSLIKGKWFRTNDRDFVGVIFLNDYRDEPPFDEFYEVVGGKLAFPNHNFSFLPKRGQLVIYPGNEYFVNATQKVLFGDLNQIKFYITADNDWSYDPKKFPGSYKEWFA
jgi:hypothetical protein